MEVIKPSKITIQVGCRLQVLELERFPVPLDQRVQLRIAEMCHQEVKLEAIKQMQRLWQDKKVQQV